MTARPAILETNLADAWVSGGRGAISLEPASLENQGLMHLNLI